MSNETLQQLKVIYDNKPDGADEFFTYQGSVNYIDNHENGHQFKIWCEDEQNWVFSELVDGWQYIRGRRSLSDIKLIIELMEAVKSLPDKLETDKWLEGLDRPTEFAISQAKSFAIGSVFDSIRKAKKLL